METVILKPRNEQELAFITEFVKRTKLRAKFIEDEKTRKKREFLDGLERGVEQINQYLRGEIDLKNAKDLLDEL